MCNREWVLSATVVTGEAKEVGTRCEWVRRVCPIRSRVRTISSLREYKFEEDHATVGLIGRNSLWKGSWFCQSSCHFSIMNELMKAERSELVGRSPALTHGKFVSCLAALSTISLSTIPRWSGTHMKVILVSVL